MSEPDRDKRVYTHDIEVADRSWMVLQIGNEDTSVSN